MNLNKKKILITGSKGFIGQNFFNYLKKYKEYEIYGFARENILGDLEILINKVDIVFHFAGVNRSCRIKDFHEVFFESFLLKYKYFFFLNYFFLL